jgi:hypothetical protein
MQPLGIWLKLSHNTMDFSIQRSLSIILITRIHFSPESFVRTMEPMNLQKRQPSSLASLIDVSAFGVAQEELM